MFKDKYSDNHYCLFNSLLLGIASNVILSWYANVSSKLDYFNISNNQIRGIMRDVSRKSSLVIDLSSNHSEGPMPKLPSTINVLDLGQNMFSGPISSLCTNRIGSLSYLDLSHNLLSGELPDCWKEWNMLDILLLPNNNFSGKIPNSTG